MCNQIKVQFFKLRHFVLFYLALLCMVGFGFSYGFVKIASVGGEVYDAFAATVCDASFMFVSALVGAWFIGSDFSNRTIHHEIALGYSRCSVLLVRELPVLLSGVLLHLVYTLSAVLGTGLKVGFSFDSFSAQDIFWCLTVVLQLIALQSIIALISFICAKAPAAITASVSIIIVMCNILRNFLGCTFYSRTVFYLAPDNEPKTLIISSAVAVITFALSLAAAHLIFIRKDIE